MYKRAGYKTGMNVKTFRFIGHFLLVIISVLSVVSMALMAETKKKSVLFNKNAKKQASLVFTKDKSYIPVYGMDVLRNGGVIGNHKYQFSFTKKGHLCVDVVTEMDVYVLLMNFYHYRHKRNEIWETPSKLLSMKSQTHDNGDDFNLTIHRAQDNMLDIKETRMERRADGDATPVSMWNVTMFSQTTFISAFHGDNYDIVLHPPVKEILTLHGKKVNAICYKTTGQYDRSFWYDENGHFLRLAFDKDGSFIEYVIDKNTFDTWHDLNYQLDF